MISGVFTKILREREYVPVLFLILLGASLRLLCIGVLPSGLNQDEASAGYDAWALLNYGTDRCGNAFPVLLESWGSGQNALMSYIAVPFIALFGLSAFSVRIVNAVFGCLTLIVFWLAARRVRGRGFGICALFALAVCPWHIMASRWALESNLFPFFLTLGFYLTVKARENDLYLLGAALSFGLSLYSYGTAFFFLPPFLALALIRLNKKLKPAHFVASFTAFALISLPISLCQYINAAGGESMTFLGLTLPELTSGRQMAVSLFGGGGLPRAAGNFKAFLHILITQSDSLSYNSIPEGGLLYFFGPALSLAGILISIFSRAGLPAEAHMRDAFYCGLICAFLTEPNINRMNMMWIPFVYFASVSLYCCLCKLKSWSVIPVAGILVCLTVFINAYITEFKSSYHYYPGLGRAVSAAESFDPESVYITDYVNQPYIFALFYSGTPPDVFSDTVDYANPDGAFRQVKSFGHYKFGPADEAEGEYIILHRSEVRGFDIIAEFGDFALCPGR